VRLKKGDEGALGQAAAEALEMQPEEATSLENLAVRQSNRAFWCLISDKPVGENVWLAMLIDEHEYAQVRYYTIFHLSSLYER
jgi:hypothetical protein